MELSKFLDRVLPSGGNYFVGMIHDGKFMQTKADTRKDLDKALQTIIKSNKDTYYATGTFENSKRVASDIKEKKCFYVDIDCGEGKPFATKTDAVKELSSFCKRIKLPLPNIIVDSGGGVHGYWVLATPAGRGEWELVASALKGACSGEGFSCDSAVTADAARVLRVPTSINNKNGKTCTVIHNDEQDFDLLQLAKPLASYTNPASENVASEVADLPDRDVPTVDNTDLELESTHKLSYTGAMVRSCPALKQIALTGGKFCQEPLWMKTLNILAFTEDGNKAIHLMSKGHKDYNKAQTEAKFEMRLKAKAQGTTGPTLCSSFNAEMPDICGKCPHFNKIKSPIVLGFEQNEIEYKVTNEMPAGYYQVDNKGVFKGTGKTPKRIFPYNIRDFECFHSVEHGGIALKFSYSMGDFVSTCQLPYSCLHSPTDFVSKLSKHGIALHRKEQTEMKILMTTWYQQMQRVKRVRVSTKQMGWTEKGETNLQGFITARKAYYEDGSTNTVLFKDDTANLVYTAKGEYEPWRKACQHVLDQNLPDAAVAIASSFAAPLISMTDVSGATLSLMSNKSGTGKSTCLKIAQAVWGCPRRGIYIHGDTSNSVFRRLGVLNNLPAFWDELVNDKVCKEFVDISHKVALGKEKSRLTQLAEQKDIGTWATLLVSASNQTLLDHIKAVQKTTDAASQRIFEICFEDNIAKRSVARAKEIFQPLYDNYGHAGDKYAQYLVNNLSEVKQVVSKNYNSIERELSAAADERFWVATVISVLSGAELATNAGICKFNVKEMKKYLYSRYLMMRDNVKENYTLDAGDLAMNAFMEYLEEMQPYTAVVESFKAKNKPQGMMIAYPQRYPVKVVKSKNDCAVRVLKKPYEAWLYETYSKSSELIKRLETDYGAINMRTGLIYDIPQATTSRQKLLHLTLNSSYMDDVLDRVQEEENE